MDGGQGKFEEAMSVDSGPSQTESGTVAASGNDFTLDATCPGTQSDHRTYTATGATLQLFGHNIALLFVLL
jgi:hypothetical protein